MSLVTQCPKCGSEYEVTADQLKLHDGLVRCGQCNNVFDGLVSLKDSLPTLTRKAVEPTSAVSAAPDANLQGAPVLDVPAPSGDSQAPATVMPPPPSPVTPVTAQHRITVDPPQAPNRASTPVITADERAMDDGPFIPSVDRLPRTTPPTSGRFEPSLGRAQPASGVSTGREPSLGSLLNDDGEQGGMGSRTEPAIKVMGESRLRGDDPSAAGRTMPEFLEDEEEPSFGYRVYWVLGSIVLALVLMVQSLVIFRNDIVSTMPGVRPMLATLCAPLGCEVSYVRQIERIFIVGAALQQDPEARTAADARAYNLRFTLQNRGAYPQPWPSVMVTLTDASGTPVIKKAFMPQAFMPAALLAGPFQAKQEVAVDIPLRVKGMSISGFELDRFFP